MTTETKTVQINVALIDAWEVWSVEVPADADEEWIENNPDQWEMIALEDAGNNGMEFEGVDL